MGDSGDSVVTEGWLCIVVVGVLGVSGVTGAVLVVSGVTGAVLVEVVGVVVVAGCWSGADIKKRRISLCFLAKSKNLAMLVFALLLSAFLFAFVNFYFYYLLSALGPAEITVCVGSC